MTCNMRCNSSTHALSVRAYLVIRTNFSSYVLSNCNPVLLNFCHIWKALARSIASIVKDDEVYRIFVVELNYL
jgi:hypothetical protein